MEKAFDKFFRKEAKYPKIKKYKDYNSITFTQFGVARQSRTNKKTGKVTNSLVRRAASFTKGGKLQISRLGAIDIHLHRKLDGRVKQVVIKKQSGKWFAIFSVEKRVKPQLAEPSNAVGIDLGVKTFVFCLTAKKSITLNSFIKKNGS